MAEPYDLRRMPTSLALVPALLLLATLGARAADDPPPVPVPEVPNLSPIGEFPKPGSEPPRLKPSDPKPALGPNSVGAFVEGIQSSDAIIEIVLGQGRILTTKEDISNSKNVALVAVGNPSVMDFVILSPRQIRLIGLRIGSTDLSISTSSGKNYSFEVRVSADLGPLETEIKSRFPDASVNLSQLSGNIVVEGQARDGVQVARIIQLVTNYASAAGSIPPINRGAAIPRGLYPTNPGEGTNPDNQTVGPPLTGRDIGMPNSFTTPELVGGGGMGMGATALALPPRVINLLRIPTSQQVLLKVRVAELDRKAIRSIGANFLGIDPKTGTIVGTQISGTNGAAGAIGDSASTPTGRGSRLNGGANLQSQSGTTVFGIFQDNNFEFMLNALRNNSMVKVLAEPNLVALSGQRASFLAGGEFPVPIPQVGASGVAPTITVAFKRYGVQLDFLPTILEGDVVRLSVAPEVSDIDNAIATTLVAGGTPVPGLRTRRAQTTVELRPGETLAIAGLLQLDFTNEVSRIPGLGDLPIAGTFFSNIRGVRQEKELVVLVTPYLVEPMAKSQVPPVPGDEVKEPTDLELYLLNRIEGRTGKDGRSTTNWDDPLNLLHLRELEERYIAGPGGFSR